MPSHYLSISELSQTHAGVTISASLSPSMPEVRCVTAVDDTKDRDEESREKPNCTQESISKYSLSQVENQLRMLQVQNETKFQTETKIISEIEVNMAKLINQV
ncbi:hypothetical protein Pint_05399 [Pistacia integerrima]|uniref:Uncharacterized protein n=1 Tax=Pistacia integerrima TaxID=434235 RepID=A0ACC0Z4R4_9ROSI|nr:hypothetical protein Pint_05399 [Pistacia integerrima]